MPAQRLQPEELLESLLAAGASARFATLPWVANAARWTAARLHNLQAHLDTQTRWLHLPEASDAAVTPHRPYPSAAQQFVTPLPTADAASC